MIVIMILIMMMTILVLTSIMLKAVRRGMTAVGPELAALFPPVLFAVGGEAAASSGRRGRESSIQKWPICLGTIFSPKLVVYKSDICLGKYIFPHKYITFVYY